MYSKRAWFLSVSESHDISGALQAAAYETCQAVFDKNAQKELSVIPNSSYILCCVWKLSLLQDL